MAPLNLYTLNAPQDTFWDFITSLNDPAGPNQQQNQAGNQRGESSNAESSEKKAADKQPTVEDENPGESSSREKGKGPDAPNDEPRGPQAPRGRCGNNESPCGDGQNHCRGRRGGRQGFGGWGRGPFGHHGPPPPFMMHHGPPGSFPFGGPEGPHGPARHCRGPPRDGPYPHPHGHPHFGPRGGPCGPRRGGNFNVNDFLTNLGSRLGLDLSGAAEGLGSGLDRFMGSSLPEGVDFEPHADIFDTPTTYLVHLSLAGAKKSDLGVDWDGENSVLRVAGVVHRPGVDEATLKALAVDGRKNEVGVFEKKVHLGSKRQPARIDVAAISAKMTDGVLVITVPKVERETTKREVPIDSSASPSPTRDAALTQDTSAPLIDLAHREKEPVPTEMEVDRDVRSPTEQGDLDVHRDQDDHEEQLPEYKEDGQQDQDDSEEEADYVKIDVK